MYIRLQSGLGSECRKYSADVGLSVCLKTRSVTARTAGREEKREVLHFSLPQVTAI